MRTIVIGDIHGRTQWQDVVKNEQYDNVVFLGDYVDSHEESITPEDFKINLENIINFKKDNFDKVVLLYGNHDASYLNFTVCSGYNGLTSKLCSPLFKEAFDKKMLQPIYIQNDIIFSHAGVSLLWMDLFKISTIEDITFDNLNLNAFNYNYYGHGDLYRTGDTESQSPIWIRPYSLIKSAVNGYRQIVGHSVVDEPQKIGNLYFIDCFPNYYVVVEDGTVSYVKM